MLPRVPSADAMMQNHGICSSTEGRSQNTIIFYATNLQRFLQFLKKR
ncbi:hypothetical protein ACFLTP_09470 [Chloroflexota bacterium]